MVAAVALTLTMTVAGWSETYRQVVVCDARLKVLDAKAKSLGKTYGAYNAAYRKAVTAKEAAEKELRDARKEHSLYLEKKAKVVARGGLAAKNLTQDAWTIGEVAYTDGNPPEFAVFQVIDKNNVLIYRANPVWLVMDTTGMTDSSTYTHKGRYRYEGTVQYKTVTGSRTVRKFTVLDN